MSPCSSGYSTDSIALPNSFDGLPRKSLKHCHTSTVGDSKMALRQNIIFYGILNSKGIKRLTQYCLLLPPGLPHLALLHFLRKRAITKK